MQPCADKRHYVKLSPSFCIRCRIGSSRCRVLSCSLTPWFVYPLLGWGIGLSVHWVNQYNNLRTRRSATSRMRATPPLAATCPQSDDD